MARFDIYEYAGKSVPLVVDVQADLLSDLNTCVVVPLIPEAKAKKEETLGRHSHKGFGTAWDNGGPSRESPK